jgi:hypothetical protein
MLFTYNILILFHCKYVVSLQVISTSIKVKTAHWKCVNYPFLLEDNNLVFSRSLDLNQYTVRSYARRVTTLMSPRIFQRKACFMFQYYVPRYSSGYVFVFARNASNGKFLPFGYKNVNYDRGKWHTIKILLHFESGFDQVSRLAFNTRAKIRYTIFYCSYR